MSRGLKDVCAVFNHNKVEYMIAGAHACALQGHIRATEDIDILIKNSPENLERTVMALMEIFPDLPEKITTHDISDNIVLKIADDIEVDVSISAWSVSYDEALPGKENTVIDGVDIPYLGIKELIRSKSTSREIDIWDVRILEEILRKKGTV